MVSMTQSAQIEELKAMASRARRLAKATTDRMTIDVLESYADECDDRAASLQRRPDNRH